MTVQNYTNIQVLSIDLDGTLLQTDGTVAPITVDALNECRAQGMHLIFNTARPASMIPKPVYEVFRQDYWVFSNGTTAQKEGKELFNITMDARHIAPLITRLHTDYSHFFFSIESGGRIYAPCIEKQPHSDFKAELHPLERLLEKAVNKVTVIAEDRNFPHHEITALLTEDQRLLITEDGKYIQVMPRLISKCSAVEYITESLGLDMSHVVAFGDDVNDIELLVASGIGVAMANANALVRSKADCMTTSNNDNGVGNFVTAILQQRIHHNL